MQYPSPLWPAQLDHLRLDSDDPTILADFYAGTIGFTQLPQDDGTVILQGRARRLVIGRGERRSQPWTAFRLGSPQQLAALRDHIAGRGIAIMPSPSPVFDDGAIAVRDPDGRLVLFGVPRQELDATPLPPGEAAALPGRLQHVVVASTRLPEMMRFYEEGLGFLPSDYVLEKTGNREPTTAFYRSDPEHHCFAVFRCPETRPDHHAYEANCWNDIRDWADFMASRRIPLWWGPGRHGVGNNLFFMIEDPSLYLAEISTELEIVPDGIVRRTWPHEERTLNLWGRSFMRS